MKAHPVRGMPYDSNLDSSASSWTEAMELARFKASVNPHRQYSVRRRRSYDPRPMNGPWIVQSVLRSRKAVQFALRSRKAATTTVRFVDGREIELPGTEWRIGDTFRTAKGGSRVITGRDIHDGVLVSAQ